MPNPGAHGAEPDLESEFDLLQPDFPPSIPVAASPTPASKAAGGWRLSNWRLRTKTAAVLLVPAIAAAAFAGLSVREQLSQAATFVQVENQIQLAKEVVAVIGQVEVERVVVADYVAAGRSTDETAVNQQTAQTDAAIAGMKSTASSLPDLSPAIEASYQSALSAISVLPTVRTTAATSKFPATAVIDVYTNALNALLQVPRLVSASATNGELVQQGNAIDAVVEQQEEFSLQTAILAVAARNGAFPAGEVAGSDALRSAIAENEASVSNFDSSATTAALQTYNAVANNSNIDEFNRQQQNALTEDTNNQPLNIDPAAIENSGNLVQQALTDVQTTLANDMFNNAAQLNTDARNTAYRELAVVVGVLLLAILFAFFIARSIVSPLRRLRTGALNTAQVVLPAAVNRILASDNPIEASREAVEPVPPFSREEVGEVARSFDVVHGQAVRLAAEQAVLRDNVNAIFVNLSRRSQALVERQLALIDRLERDEQDPDQLANLFELDHLATRMRRNSESLLVLSGSGLAKRMSRPVPIGELVGAAVSEVEQYARIEVGSPPDSSVLGRAVNDLIHLIAELLDNATTYSEPNTKVSVRIARTKARELAIQITDRGVGMSEDDVRRANENLANPPDIDVSVTRRMGLYVVARLAKRHGIRVRLRANEDIDGGAVALVVIPGDLIYRPGDDPMGGLPPEAVAQQLPTRDGSVAHQAAAAAGIAGAFGMASNRPAEQPPAQLSPANNSWPSMPSIPPLSIDTGGSGPIGVAGTLGPDGRHDRSGPIHDSGPTSAPIQPVAGYWSDTGPTPLPPTSSRPVASPSSNLWEPYTAADALPEHPSVLGGNNWSDDPAATTFIGTVDTGSTPAPAPRPIEVDAPTERLPIYEAVLSQWFRPDEAPEMGAPMGNGALAGPMSGPAMGGPIPEQPLAASAADSNGAGESDLGALPTRVPGKAGKQVGFTAGASSSPSPLAAAEPASAGNGSPVGASNGFGDAFGNGNGGNGSDPWQSQADEGWQAAQALLAPVADVTSAGLPKRVPKAHLVPGSARPRHDADAAPFGAGEGGSTGQMAGDLVGAGAGGRGGRMAGGARPTLPPRSADAVRGRMSSFQKGLRRGRHALVEGYSGEASHSSDPIGVEEQE